MRDQNSAQKSSLNSVEGQLNAEWIYEVSIFQNSNKIFVRISALKILPDHLFMFAIAYIY